MPDGPVKMVIKDGWIACPNCSKGRRKRYLLRITDETEATNLPVYCRDCKQTFVLNIARGQSVERRSP